MRRCTFAEEEANTTIGNAFDPEISAENPVEPQPEGETNVALVGRCDDQFAAPCADSTDCAEGIACSADEGEFFVAVLNFPDRDEDGIPDNEDNCPDDPNPSAPLGVASAMRL